MRKPKTKPARNIHGCGELKEGYYLCWQTKAGKHEIGGNFAALRNICNTVNFRYLGNRTIASPALFPQNSFLSQLTPKNI